MRSQQHQRYPRNGFIPLAVANVAFRSAKDAWVSGSSRYIRGANGDFGCAILNRERYGQRAGLSLLEVVLALSILGIATGILSTIMQQSADTGLRSRRMTQAELVCESKMAEAMAGALLLESTQWTPVASIDGASWYYSLEVIQAEQPNLIGVVIQVNDELAMTESTRPLSRLVQWIIDPSLGLDTKPETTSSDATGQSSGTTGTSPPS